jgi:hypothetical protein
MISVEPGDQQRFVPGRCARWGQSSGPGPTGGVQLGMSAGRDEGAPERWGTCPRCELPVRLTEAEVSAKKGFCARCGATFEITRQVRDSPSPFRDSAAVTLVPSPASPPTPRIRSLVDDRQSELVILSRSVARGVMAIAVTAGFGAFLAWMALTGGARSLAGLVLYGLAVGGPVLILSLRQLFGHDRVAIRDGALWSRKVPALGGGEERTPLGAVREVAVEEDAGRGLITLMPRGSYRIRVLRDGRKPLLLGRGMTHDQETIRWVERWLKEHIDRALS